MDDFEFSSCAVCVKLLDWNCSSKTTAIVSAFLENSSDSSKSNCPVCLGILERQFSEALANDTVQKFRSANFDTDSFNLAITLPPSCLLREKVARFWTKKDEKQSIDESNFILSLKDACRLCYQAAFERLLSPDGVAYDAQSDFTISLTFENSKADECCEKLQRCFPERRLKSGKKDSRWKNGEKTDGNNSEWSRAAIVDVLPLLTDELLRKIDVNAIFGDFSTTCSINFSRSPLFVGGRYCKYSRYLSQTPWILDGVRRGTSSVQELICDQFVPLVGAEDAKFTASGREDTDVRMLGDGRPFAVQFINARRKRTLDQKEIEAIEHRINESTKDISVHRLRVINADEFATLKEGEEHKKKTYAALVCSPNSLGGDLERKRILELPSLGAVELEQKTPIRVLHRRPLAIRRRTVEDFRVIILSDHSFLLRLTTQAGTYVKEFVHGDFGRTVPSLSDLLGGICVDITELDVERIHLTWP